MQINLRQTIPLAVIRTMDGTVMTRTRLMKLCFLVETQLQDEHPEIADSIDFAFYPYDYGPYSKTLVEDLEYLDSRDALSITMNPSGDRYAYSMNLQSRGSLTALATERDDVNAVVATVEAVVDDFGEHRVRELLDHVYDEYPEYHELTPFW